MRAATTFADILDAHLASMDHEPATLRIDVGAAFATYARPFVHEAPQPIQPRQPAAGATGPRPVERAPAPRAERPTSHDLSPAGQHAFLELVQCGAELRDDFSVTDLRRTFRALARRYHPDRHPDAPYAEQQQLAETFARVNSGYRLLLTWFAQRKGSE